MGGLLSKKRRPPRLHSKAELPRETRRGFKNLGPTPADMDRQTIERNTQLLVKTRQAANDPAQQNTLLDEAKFIEDGPDRTPLFVQSIPDAINNLASPQRVEFDEAGGFIMRTPVEDTVIVCAYGKPLLWVVNHKYEVTRHRLMFGKSVSGGECISTKRCIIHVKHQDMKIKSVVTTNVDILSQKSSLVEPVSEFEVSNPVRVFRYDKHKYGILCENPGRIEVYKRKDILMEDKIKSSQTIRIHRKLNYADTVCVTPDAEICVTSYRDHVVYVFNENGDMLRTLGEERGWGGKVAGGRFHWPVGIQSADDGRILVSCSWGDIHLYNGKNWWLLKDVNDKLNHCVVTENKLWSVYFETLSVYDVKNYKVDKH